MEYNVFQNNKLLDLLKNKDDWNLYKLTDMVEDDTKNAKKIKKEDYLEDGEFPIVDQGQSVIAGYSNEDNELYMDYPFIIFGDHTRILKYVDFPIFIGADGVKLLKPLLKKSELKVKYLYYFLSTVKLPSDGYSRHFKYLKEVVVPVPKVNIQEKIIEALDKAQELIDKRKEQIEALDELVKSQFIEMFGNIINNSMNWKTVKLKDICLLKSGGTPTRSKPEYFQGDIPWITTVALGKNLINENDAIEYITQEAINNSATKLIKENSLLFGMRVGVGKISVNTVPMATNQDIMAITEIDTTKYDLIFLKKIIESYSEYFNNQKRGATIQGIKSDTLKEIEIPIIASELQNNFVDFVKQVDKLKFEMENSLKELEDNFNSLMQRAFKGELFNYR